MTAPFSTTPKARNILMCWVGSYYEKMSPTAFWTMDALIAAAGALIVLLFGRQLNRALQVPSQSESIDGGPR